MSISHLLGPTPGPDSQVDTGLSVVDSRPIASSPPREIFMSPRLDSAVPAPLQTVMLASRTRVSDAPPVEQHPSRSLDNSPLVATQSHNYQSYNPSHAPHMHPTLINADFHTSVPDQPSVTHPQRVSGDDGLARWQRFRPLGCSMDHSGTCTDCDISVGLRLLVVSVDI